MTPERGFDSLECGGGPVAVAQVEPGRIERSSDVVSWEAALLARGLEVTGVLLRLAEPAAELIEREQVRTGTSFPDRTGSLFLLEGLRLPLGQRVIAPRGGEEGARFLDARVVRERTGVPVESRLDVGPVSLACLRPHCIVVECPAGSQRGRAKR